MKSKGFTLIELLVVVAIIGILAAVGTVAYNGYTTAAKNAAIKAQFKMIVKYFGAELQKCNLGEDKIFNQQLSCSDRFTKYGLTKIEYALRTSFTRIGYVDTNGNTIYAVYQGFFPSTSCSNSPHLFYGYTPYRINDKSNPVTLTLTSCDTSGNYFESTIIIE